MTKSFSFYFRLRNFACLSTGDVIAIHYNNKTYELSVLETKPAAAVSVIECDLNVDFAPPIGYQEPERPRAGGGSGGGGKGGASDEHVEGMEPMDVADLIPEPKGFVAFSGSGVRLDGRKKKTKSESSTTGPSTSSAGANENDASRSNKLAGYVRGIPDYDYELGTLKFIRAKPKIATEGADDGESEKKDFEAFKGAGQSLRSAKGKKK